MADMKTNIKDVYKEIEDEKHLLHQDNVWVKAAIAKAQERNKVRSELKQNLKKLAEEL